MGLHIACKTYASCYFCFSTHWNLVYLGTSISTGSLYCLGLLVLFFGDWNRAWLISIAVVARSPVSGEETACSWWLGCWRGAQAMSVMIWAMTLAALITSGDRLRCWPWLLMRAPLGSGPASCSWILPSSIVVWSWWPFILSSRLSLKSLELEISSLNLKITKLVRVCLFIFGFLQDFYGPASHQERGKSESEFYSGLPV